LQRQTVLFGQHCAHPTIRIGSDQFDHAFEVGSRKTFRGENLSHFFTLAFGRDFDVTSLNRFQSCYVIVF